jgi:putative nucleotidyltransferase with HDIG domain
LQVINSAYFGLPRTVTSPSEAVALLGFETARSMVTAVKLLNQYDRIKAEGFSIDSLWQHSTAVANSARQLVLLQTGERSLAEAAFAAGLLHDVGKAVLAGNFGEQYAGADSLARKQHLPLCAVEKEIFGAHHGEVGAYMLSLWGLPRNLLEAAAFHHDPARSADKTFTVLTAVHVANALQYIANPDTLGHVAPELDLGYLESIGMSECLSSWCEEVLGEEAASRYLAPKQASAKSSVPQPELAFTPPPASAVRPDPAAPEPLLDTLASEKAPAKELCAAEPAAHVEISTNAESDDQGELIVEESVTTTPADTTLSQENPQPVSTGSSRNRWLVAAGLPALGLVIVCLVVARSGRDHQDSVPVQAREPQPAQAEPAPASVTDDPRALNDVKDTGPGLDSAVSSNNVASPLAGAGSSISSPKAAQEVAAQPAVTKPTFPALKLQGILFSPQHPSAIINGALVRRNDRLDGARIVEIRQTTVTVEFQKERRILSLE